jgi:nitrite reductase/ring-hydroxylating ferredoxin subunit
MTEAAPHSSWIGRDLPPIRRDGRDYFILGHRGALYLVHNHCPHRGGALKFGFVDGQERIVCPLHHNAYSIEQLIARPTTLRLVETPSALVRI